MFPKFVFEDYQQKSMSLQSKKKTLGAKVVCEYEMYQTKPQTQNCNFEAQIYSFLFQPSVQTARKCPKSLGNKAFCAISCKSVISDKWQRYTVHVQMATLTVTKKQDLILRPCSTKPQILRFSRQRKRLTRNFAFPPLSEICKGSIQRSKLDR